MLSRLLAVGTPSPQAAQLYLDGSCSGVVKLLAKIVSLWRITKKRAGCGSAPRQAVSERRCDFAARAIAQVEAQVEERLERLALVVTPPAGDLAA